MRHAKWVVVVLGFVAVALGVGAVQGQQLSGEYKIGVLEPLTGNLAAEGKRHLEGMEIMRDLINERFGGVMGKKLVFVTGDAVDPTAAASEATRLATREGVKIITGTFSSTLFAVNTAEFLNPFGGMFSVVRDGNALDLFYTPVPEPSVAALLAVGLVALRRRRSVPNITLVDLHAVLAT